MTDDERERLGNYHRLLADRMGLKDWAIQIRDEPADDDAHAQVNCVDGRKLAKIRFDRDWAKETPECLRQTCVHELIHCHLAPVRAEMGRRLKQADFHTFMMLLEYAIDGMADAWSVLLPLMLVERKTIPMAKKKASADVVPMPSKSKKAAPKAAKTTKKKAKPKKKGY